MARHALIIGINHYPKLRNRDLRGCVNDAQAVAALLPERFGFAPADVALLLDAAATREGILAGLERLVARVGPGDVAVVFYAGHGSRVAAAEGFVEAVVAHDSGRGSHPNRDVLDFEIDAVVQRLNQVTPHVALVFDCCHSGSVTRDPFGAATREVPPDLRALPEAPGGATRPQGFAAGARAAVVVAACQAEELAAEHELFDGEGVLVHGALTWHLLQVLGQLTGPASWRDVFEALVPRLTATHPRQRPLLEGRADSEVFGPAARPRVPAVAVRAVDPDGEGATLSGGAAHGLAVGDRLALVPPLGGESLPAEVTRVAAVSAQVRWRESFGPVVPGWRAEATAHRLPGATLAVGVEAPAAEAERLRAALASRPMLSAVGPDAGRILVRRTVEGWVAVDHDGRLAARQRSPAEVLELAVDLERVARFEGLLSLRNPAPDLALAQAVRLEVHRVVGGVARPAEGASGDGVPRFVEGERADFVIRNHGAEPVYLSLLQFGTDRAIDLLLPRPGHPTWQPGHGYRLAGGAAVSLWGYFEQDPELKAAVAGGLPLLLPEGFPWAPDGGAADRDGVLSLKLMITRVPADFEFVTQLGTRSAEAVWRDLGPHPLAALVAQYGTGKEARSFLPRARLEEVAEVGWATLTRSVIVSRTAREIDPGGSGMVLFYKVRVGTQDVGRVGVTAESMATLPTDVGYWDWFPTSWPDAFALVPDEEVAESKAASQLGSVALTNPRFETSARSLDLPASVEKSWRIEKNGNLLGYLAKSGSYLFWYGIYAGDRLPRSTLTFTAQSLPTSGSFYHAVDKPV